MDQIQGVILHGPSWIYLKCWMAMNQATAYTFVDLDDPDLKRQPKLSAHWYSNFLKGKNISSDEYIELKKNISAVSPYLLE